MTVTWNCAVGPIQWKSAYGRRRIFQPMRIIAPIPKFAEKPFFLRQFYTLYETKFSNLRPFLSITFSQGFWKSKKFGHLILEKGGKKMFKCSQQIKKSIKKHCCGVFKPFLRKVFNSKTTSFHYFSPPNLKSLDIGLQEVGAKRPLNLVRKCDRQTDRQTYKNVDL